MSSPTPTLRVQINQLDHTLAQPGFLDNSSLPQVPIIRIYGGSSTGTKTCVHIHQVYPYFFVEYTGEMTPDVVNRYIVRLSKSLNHAMAISLRRNPLSPNSQFVRAVLLVKGVHFYGFHASYSPFLKILIVDPALLSRAATIMQSGTIMQTRFRVFESHLGYILQFMCDFGLYGCGWIDLDEVWQRGNDLESNTEEENVSTYKPSLYFRESRMALEVDAASHQILNRRLLSARNIHHKLEIPAPPISTEPLVLSVRELWEDERSRRQANGLPPTPELPVDPSEKSRGIGGGWDAEAMWWDELRQRIQNEREEGISPTDSETDWERWIMTTFESVEALWERRWKSWKPSSQDCQDVEEAQQEENPFEAAAGSLPWNTPSGETEAGFDVEVDESMLSSQEISQLVDLEEDDWDEQNRLADEDDDGALDEEEPLDPTDIDPDSPRGLLNSQESGDQVMLGTPDPHRDSPSKSIRKQPNPFRDAWLKIARSRGPSTPTKSLQRSSSSMSPLKRMASAALVPTQTHDEQQNVPQELVETAQDSVQSQNHDQFGVSSRPLPSSTNAVQFDLTLDTEGPSLSYSQPLERVLTEGSQTRRGDQHAPDDQVEDPENDRGQQQSNTSSSFHSHSPSAQSSSLPIVPIQTVPLSATLSSSQKSYVYAAAPPPTSELQGTINQFDLPDKIYRDPYYSNESDAPERPREYSGLLYNLKGGTGPGVLEEWDMTVERATGVAFGERSLSSYSHCITGWEYASCPPSIREVKKWLQSDAAKPQNAATGLNRTSQIEGPTQDDLQDVPVAASDASRTKQGMTILSLEVFAPSLVNVAPDPGIDEIVAVFYSFQGSHGDVATNTRLFVGKLFVENERLDLHRLRDVEAESVPSELELLNRVVDVVIELDPDLIVGWDVKMASWGYLNARGLYYGLDVGDLISRAPPKQSRGGADQWEERMTSTFKAVGRHVLNLWRIMRHEQTLNIYTFENVVFHVLRRRVPRYSSSTLTGWYNSSTPSHTARLIRYFAHRTSMVLEILEQAEIITKTAEFARVFGVDFFSVLSRGSQFKVESFMFRIAKPESFVLLSPSKLDVGKQNAAECMPLIMEPLSAFYNSPLVVLDFQSLYPSVMIAYNYCYSTCLGRITDFNGRYKLGVVDIPQPAGLLDTLQEHITVAPNGIMYANPSVRKGLLGRMLTELLQTRVMVKQAMKNVKGDRALRQILDARQLGLKFICNVTYGYASASYSGRMPAVEIADSIVQSGRETLEKAVRIINSCPKWGAQVVYGDTDSLFVYLRGRTKAQAFKIGNDIADSITALNPFPIKLKFEKVYLPCVLMAKKRYVGFKYESPDDGEPVFDAKGIETVRRDGVPAQQKMVENCLKILFRTQDLSQVKSYCWRSWMRVLENKISVQDFIFAKEVRMGSYSDKVPPPPGVAVATKRMTEGEDEPQYGERVPYVIVRSGPNSRLVDRAVSPQEVLSNRQMHLDGVYYISSVLIPPLERIFNLVGADVRGWYEEMPKAIKADHAEPITSSPTTDTNRFKIDEHFQNCQCLNCGAPTLDRLCYKCRLSSQTTISGLLNRMRILEQRLSASHETCVSCTASESNETIECESLDCPWMFERKKAENKAELISVLEECMNELAKETHVSSCRVDTIEYDDRLL